jgi:hypothetical protein
MWYAGEYRIEIVRVLTMYEEGSLYKGMERLQRHLSV